MEVKMPQNWTKCPRFGNKIDLFVPFKVPLETDKFNVPPTRAFTIQTIYEEKPDIGLIIDLTNSYQYYKFNLKNIKYEKIKCEGHKNPPTESQVDEFISCVDSFVKDHSDSLIGVHCTHGFNRTGFMIISFLVVRKKYDIKDAIYLFSECRKPGIYKQDYIDELVRRYSEIKLELIAPTKPFWHIEDKRYDCEEIEIPGVVKITDNHKIVEILAKVRKIVFDASKKGKFTLDDLKKIKLDQFIGEYPVSLSRKNIHLLANQEYKVSWRAHGSRYLMVVVGPGEVYMLDRNNSVFLVENVSFWSRKDLNQHLTDLLMDGEMIKSSSSRKKPWRYSIYDIIAFPNTGVGGCNFSLRKLCIDKEIIGPRNQKSEEGLLDKNSEPFSITNRKFLPLSFDSKLLNEKFSNNLFHENNDLIFQPNFQPYHFGPSHKSLKWKPSFYNTVDFKLKVVVEKVSGGMPKMKAYISLLNESEFIKNFQIKYDKSMKSIDGKIVECNHGSCYPNRDDLWHILRVRTDRDFPNSLNTADSILSSIHDDITKEDLIEYIDGISNKK